MSTRRPAGGEPLRRSPGFLRHGGTIVTIAQSPPDSVEATHFLVDPDLINWPRCLRSSIVVSSVRRSIVSTSSKTPALRSSEAMTGGKRGKVVIRVGDE